MNRRDMLGILAAGAIMPRAALAAASRAMRAPALDRVGIQLYTMLASARRDMAGALGTIASAGFAEVELLDSMGNLGVAPARMRELLDAAGLRAPSTHTTTGALDDLGRLTRDARTLGHEYVVVVSLPIDRRNGAGTLDDYRRWADRLNAAGKLVRAEGLWLGFHNEPTDFLPIGGTVPYDVFLEALDPAAVRLQLDTGNAAMGGVDPLRYMTRHASRFWQFHMKDVTGIGAKGDTEIGTGSIDFARLLAAVGPTAGKHFYLEQEPAAGMTIDGLRRSHRYLAGLR